MIYTSCTSYRQLLSIQPRGTNARAIVNWFTEEPPSRSGIRTQLNTNKQNIKYLTAPTALPADVISLTNTDRISHQQTYICELTQVEEY